MFSINIQTYVSDGVMAYREGFSYKRTLMKLSGNPWITNCPYKSVQGQE